MKITTLLSLLALNAASRERIVDRRTGQPVVLWRGNGVTFRCAAFVGDPTNSANLVTDWSDAVSATLVVREDGPTGTVLITKTVPVANFNTALIFSEWTDGSGHFDFVLTGAETNQTMSSDGTLPIYWAVELATTDPDPITIGTGIGTIREDGIGNPGTPTTPDYTAWSKLEADARFIQSANLGSSVPELRLGITALTGGGPTALDGIPTTNLTTPRALFLIRPNEPLACYQLEAGTAAESVPNIIRPDDFHAVTNAKIWVRKL
jgi:hypothetical protein